MLKSTKLRTELMKYLFLGWFNHYIAQIKISYYWWMDRLHYKDFLKITHYTLKNTFPLGNSIHFEIASFKLFLINWQMLTLSYKNFWIIVQLFCFLRVESEHLALITSIVQFQTKRELQSQKFFKHSWCNHIQIGQKKFHLWTETK